MREVASFLANIGVESCGLTRVEESLNYSAKRMAEVWPRRFAINPNASAEGPAAERAGQEPCAQS
jgi:putative chitinase